MPVPLNNNNADPLSSNFEEVRSRVRQNSLRIRTLTSGSGSGRLAEEESDTEVRSQERTRQKKFCKYFKELQGSALEHLKSLQRGGQHHPRG